VAKTADTLILASASAARARLLDGAGVAFSVAPAEIDEASIKKVFRERAAGAEACALVLASAKAAAVSARHPEALVVGADQLLVIGDLWFDKPDTLGCVIEQLEALRGRTHTLVTAVCVTRNGERLWHTVTAPCLTMHDFSAGFLADYIATEGTAVLGSVGAYRFEGRGTQLFSRIEGDYFSILGLPLIELLGFLRRCGALPA